MKRWSTAAGLAFMLAAAGCALSPPVQTRTRRVTTVPEQKADVGRRAAIRLRLTTQYLGASQSVAALEGIKNVITIDLDIPSAYHIHVLAYMNLGQCEQMNKSFHNTLAAAPQDGDLLNGCSWFLCSQDDKSGQGMAMSCQATGVPAAGSPAKPWTNLDVCQMRQDDSEGAQRSLTRTTYINTNDSLTSLTLAQLYYKRRKYSRTMPFIERVNGCGGPTTENLWLSARITRRLGDTSQQNAWNTQL